MNPFKNNNNALRKNKNIVLIVPSLLLYMARLLQHLNRNKRRAIVYEFKI